MPSLHPLRALATALLLAACQTGTDGSRSPVMGGASTATATSSAEVDAVMAFGEMCGTLERAEVARRAMRFGFLPVRRDAMPADLQESLTRVSGTLFIRPGGPPAMLIWGEPGSCELWVGGVDPEALDREFALFLRAVESVSATARLGVTRLTPEEVARAPSGEGMQVRQGALIAPRGLVPGANRVMLLRVVEIPGTMRALMVHRLASAAPAQPAAARADQLKDPMR